MSDGLSRRSFLKLAATASAAAAIPGCEPAARKLIPYVVPDENVIPGVPILLRDDLLGVFGRMRHGRASARGPGNQARGQSRRSRSARARYARAVRRRCRDFTIPTGWANRKTRRADGALEEISWDEAAQHAQRQAHRGVEGGQGSRRFYRHAAGTDARQDRQACASGAAIRAAWSFGEAISDEPARAAGANAALGGAICRFTESIRPKR